MWFHFSIYVAFLFQLLLPFLFHLYCCSPRRWGDAAVMILSPAAATAAADVAAAAVVAAAAATAATAIAAAAAAATAVAAAAAAVGHCWLHDVVASLNLSGLMQTAATDG